LASEISLGDFSRDILNNKYFEKHSSLNPSQVNSNSLLKEFEKKYLGFLCALKYNKDTELLLDFYKDKEDKLVRIKNTPEGNKLRDRIQKECIKPMLDFQLEHTKKVNTLLMKMFKIEKLTEKNKSQIKLRLQPSIKTMGKDGVNKIGAEAHDLLLNYYLKSEALYIRGVYIFEQNISSLEFI
jgi:hypothetical protein